MKHCQFARKRAQTATAMDEDDEDSDDDDDDEDDEEKEERKAQKRAAATAAAGGDQLPLDSVSELRDVHDRALAACGQHFTMVGNRACRRCDYCLRSGFFFFRANMCGSMSSTLSAKSCRRWR